jgi:spermidine/putrescine-binding protein
MPMSPAARMMRTLTATRFIAFCLAAAALAPLSGCISTSNPKTGEYTYLTGNLVSYESASLEHAWTAAQDAIKQLEFTVKSTAKDALDARLEAKQADGTDVSIKLSKASESVTEVSVRVGILGDQERSRLIMDKIKANLPK